VTTNKFFKGKLNPFVNFVRNPGIFSFFRKRTAPIDNGKYLSRDLSWMEFNYRVLEQSKENSRTLFDKLKFLAITSSNMDEFFQIRIGSLYNYLDYGKERVDYSGLREEPFRKRLLSEVQQFYKNQQEQYKTKLEPDFVNNGFAITGISVLHEAEKSKVSEYFHKIIFPMLTPMVFDNHHSFPILMNKVLIFAVITKTQDTKRLSFVQLPQNLARFFEITREDKILFVPIEEIIRYHINKLFRNKAIISVTLFRITRNGDFSLEESDDMDARYIDEIKKKLKTRRTGRVVRIEIEPEYPEWMMAILKERWEIDDYNIFVNDKLIDYTGLWQIVKNKEFRSGSSSTPAPVDPINYSEKEGSLFDVLKEKDLLLHHPYNSMEPVIDLLEKAAEDPNVLAIKITIYRLARQSRITDALLKAAENGVHVSVLFEVKARFDEENNIKEAQRLQKAGCFVIYGISNYKTHTKLMLIVRKDELDVVTRYVHMSSGNYNEVTARLYTDLSLLTTNEIYANDVSEFFNVITGNSQPVKYEYLITAPGDMRNRLIELINTEAENAKNGLPSGIVIKINSLQDIDVIDTLYAASQAGVRIKLIVRGMCCLKPGKKGLSENITVKSVVGDFLEHARIYYFHNNNDNKVYGGSADIMVRSLDRRIESLFLVVDPFLKQQVINILDYNLRDNVNSYYLHENGKYTKKDFKEKPFNIHEEFYKVTREDIMKSKVM
jgi:polyphosphate kinase